MSIAIERWILVLRHRIVGPIQRPLLSRLFVSVVFQVHMIVFLTTAAGKVDHVGVAWILRKEYCFFAQSIVVEIFVESEVAEMICVQEIGSKRCHSLNRFRQLSRD